MESFEEYARRARRPRMPSEPWQRFIPLIPWIIGALLLLGFVLDTSYTVEPHEQAVVLRFGKYHATTMPGLHFKLPMIDQVMKVSVEALSTTKRRRQLRRHQRLSHRGCPRPAPRAGGLQEAARRAGAEIGRQAEVTEERSRWIPDRSRVETLTVQPVVLGRKCGR